MGAELEITTLRASTTDKLRIAFEELRLEARRENGNGGYSGTFADAPGLDIHDGKTFASKHEAAAYIDAHAKKWENAIAVPLHSVSEATLAGALAKAKAYQKAVKAADKAQLIAAAASKDYSDARAAARAAAVGSAKPMLKCRTCGSSVSTKHIRGDSCPVCSASHSLSSKAVEAKLLKLEAKATAKSALSDEAQAKASSVRTGIKASLPAVDGVRTWLVGGVFPC